MKIVTFNIRCLYCGKDGINSFVHRAVMLCDKINAEKPDVVGFQEITADILSVLEKLLPDYLLVGQLRGADYNGEGLYTAIRKESVSLLGLETVWLSPTPYVPGSRFENQSDCPRICVATKLLFKESGRVMRVFNIHLDHISEEARMLGIKAAFEFADGFKDGAETVFLGDFNAKPDSDTVAYCNARLVDLTKKIEVSFHGYGKTAVKIDYIYTSEEVAAGVTDVYAWTDEKHGIYLSDHYPICAVMGE
ncbi:MAG: endonuclease/exonuclease/phosphatase family protein [Clostridia bacterium]|nr:endonuclease/exonuclease/phosphatase family protein [Clostridia bacterium]